MTNTARLKLAKARPGPSYAHIRRAVALFRNDLAPRSVRRHNARQWLAAVAALGPKWVYAVPVKRKEA